jgi:hypothetical protein
MDDEGAALPASTVLAAKHLPAATVANAARKIFVALGTYGLWYLLVRNYIIGRSRNQDKLQFERSVAEMRRQ